MELTYNYSTQEGPELSVLHHSFLESGKQRSSLTTRSMSLVLTKDHPLYSATKSDLVSMAPSITREDYGLNVSQMQVDEKLRHYSGDSVHVGVRPWQGNVSHVITLRLENYHWFYANGVLVHNKGGAKGGRSSGAGSAGRAVTRTVTHTRASMGRGVFVGFLFLRMSSRRRYGRYDQENEECVLHDSATVARVCRETVYSITNCNCELAQGGASVCKRQLEVAAEEPALRSVTGGNITDGSTCSTSETVCQDCCHKCFECETEACAEARPGCEDFLEEAYKECSETVSASYARCLGLPFLLVSYWIIFS